MTRSLCVTLLYNAPALAPHHPDYASEAGVLESVVAMAAALRSAGHQVFELPAAGSVASLARELADLRPDLVVNLCESWKGGSAAESHVAALLELLGLAYTGSPPECLALARDKARTKRLLAGAGIATPEFVELSRGQSPPTSPLQHWLTDGPLIVKPACEDASLGIGRESVVGDRPSLERQVALVHERYGAALVEKFIAGREFNVGIIELPQLEVLPLAEIEFQTAKGPSWPIVTYDGKWRSGSPEDLATPVLCPAQVEPDLAQRLHDAAVAACRLTGCRDYARVDLRVDSAGKVFILEVNANPDIGPQAGLARMLAAAGIDYAQFARRLAETAAGRHHPLPLGEGRGEGNIAIRLDGRDNLPIGIRPFQPDDVTALLEIARSCSVFRGEELETAAEVLYDAARHGPAGHYQVLVAETAGRPAGWTCHGRVPLTDATFDLYWLVVAPDAQRLGVGHRLIAEVEKRVRSAGGRWLLAETSSTAPYNAARAFYLRCGYLALSEIADFYRPTDGRITFGKRLDEHP